VYGPAPVVPLQTPRQTFSKIPFAYKRASRPFRSEMACPVYEQARQATGLFFGNGIFTFHGRLTGFGCARNIVRIRTIKPAAEDAI
jgi:hypothetical protein